VTFWVDLEPRTAATGALRVIPGSHLPEFEGRLCDFGATAIQRLRLLGVLAEASA
jgi:ectoine hydroxylase-related dioxygenase (phytanoyl-CoA dioxygenase family)